MKNRSVLLTGATGGLGRAVVEECRRRGAKIVCPLLPDDDASALEGSGASIVRADLSAESDVARVVAGMDELDVCLHLVGGFDMGPTVDWTLERWRAMFALNVESTFLVLRESLRRMTAGGYGRIVTVGARAIAAPPGGLAAYAGSKAAVVALTRSIAQEAIGTGVTANSVLPSVIDTPANRRGMPDADFGSWVPAESLARTVADLGSESSGHLRGAAIVVSGDVPE